MLDKLNDLSNLSNLLVHEVDPSAGYARRSIIIDDEGTGDPEDMIEIPMGKLVYRLTSASSLNLNASYTVFDKNEEYDEGDSGPGAEEDGIKGLLPVFNYAVVFGDKYSAKDLWFTSGSGENDAVAFVRGEVQLKAHTVWEANDLDPTSDVATCEAIKALLERQGIILLDSYETKI